ncbi:MAG TPA: TetR/AcrR family transcriptional regulator [Spongiibacteraceae bacterium]|nr:TetR family transcriptional regulator [Spongiibacteraceae bacterium]HCS29307.1 TetR/AcrR family transcriptional regulator [Spongiibacteraceae bacterium]|tara:strand:+ start:338 stop:1000 length:663 start_codon:yes stop_codon:yes gene_type:complete
MPTQVLSDSNVRRLASDTIALPADVTPPGPKAGILNTALRLFAERGYAGASIRDIASTTGLKPASIYAHYASKEQMLAQLITLGHEEHLQYVQQALAKSESAAQCQLRAWVEGHVRFHAEFPMLAMLVNHELHALSAEQVAPALKLREQATTLMMDIICRGQAEGTFSSGFDSWLAGAAIGAMGIRVAHWYSENHENSIDEIVSNYQGFACRIVGLMDKA